jgi:hypothetical protein
MDAPPRPPSSLSTLSLALEKLNAPAPERPNTSMGFHHDGRDSDEDEVPVSTKGKGKARTQAPSSSMGRRPSLASKDDINLGTRRTPSKPPLSTIGVKRPASTVGSSLAALEPVRKRQNSVGPTSAPGHSRTSSGSSTGGGAGQVKTPLGFGSSSTGRGPFGVRGAGTGIMGQRVAARASRKPALPMVEGSPVKGGERTMDGDVTMTDASRAEPNELQQPQTPTSTAAEAQNALTEVFTPTDDVDDTKSKSSGWLGGASRRASLASKMLAQSLQDIPQTPPAKEMPPPPVPAHATNGSGGSRSSSRLKAAAAAASDKADAAHVSKRGPASSSSGTERSAEASGGKGKASTPKAATLDVLRDCTIFVDVRTDEGDDAGGLFKEMLQGLGARLLARVGSSCTHIVFKNGLMSTVTRWRYVVHPDTVRQKLTMS